MKNTFKLFVLAFLVSASLDASALDQVIRCDNCASTSVKAAQSGSAGLKVIADYGKNKLAAYNVEYDSERRKWLTFSATIPSGIQNVFNVMTSQSFVASGALVIVHVGQPGQIISNTSAFHDAGAYDIVQSATLRSSLGRELATNWSAANSSSTNWNDIAFSLTSLTISALSSKGIEQLTFRLEFSDGSVAYYTISSDDTAQADYSPGKSADSDHNKIPDSSAVGAGGGNFIGNYHFSNPSNLQDWIDSARMAGTQFNGQQSQNMSCSWNGQTLSCRFL